VSVRYALPVAVFDQRGVAGATLVRFARGDEAWADLGGSSAEHPDPGEVIFADATDAVSARRWCWRQSRASAAREDTTDVLVTVEGHHETARADVTAALGDLVTLLTAEAGAVIQRRAILDAANPSL
jgi:DNA/RNA-binding domain of Phe-tRNA-synthetase-like protein